MNKCNKCGAGLIEGDSFCRECGAKIVLPTPVDLAGTDGSICNKCSAVIPMGSEFCGMCGAATKITCSKCQNEMPYGFRFCNKCGIKIEVESPPSLHDDLLLQIQKSTNGGIDAKKKTDFVSILLKGLIIIMIIITIIIIIGTLAGTL